MKPSFFKLPAIFTLSFCISGLLEYIVTSLPMDSSSFGFAFLTTLDFSTDLIMWFLIGILCCYHYKIHLNNNKNRLMMVILGILVYTGFSSMSYFKLEVAKTYIELGYFDSRLFILSSACIDVIALLLSILLFKLAKIFCCTEDEPCQFSVVGWQHIHRLLYCLFFGFVSILLYRYFMIPMILTVSDALFIYFDYFMFGTMYLIEIWVTIALLYWFTCNQFAVNHSGLQLSKTVKSVLLTYGYMLLFSLFLAVIILFLFFTVWSHFFYTYPEAAVNIFSAGVNLLSILALYKFSHLAIRHYFKAQQNSNNLPSV